VRVELRNAEGWRVETNQIISDITARLLDWMSHFDEAQCGSSHEVATQIGTGLRDLLDASAVAVLVREENRLTPLYTSWSPVAPNTGSEGETGVPSAVADRVSAVTDYSATALLTSSPRPPFFFETASPTLQAQVGELSNFLESWTDQNEAAIKNSAAGPATTPKTRPVVQEAASLDELSREPSLLVPLLGVKETITAGHSSSITGFVLLWVRSTDGLLPETLRLPLEAAARQGAFWLRTAIERERNFVVQKEFSAVLSDVIDDREPYRMGHSRNVAHWCGVIARELKVSPRDIEIVEMAGLLHGIGKISVADVILQTERALSADQRDGVRAALVAGADKLRSIGALEGVSLAIRHQGERWDGGGYPNGLQGEDIPLGARVLAVAQRFCAMTRARSERRAMSIVGGAFEALAADSGKALDPRVVQALLQAMGRTL
jgi:HD-GYP domain-containing protein (c-di-GMP phosphodiesterase class II)